MEPPQDLNCFRPRVEAAEFIPALRDATILPFVFVAPPGIYPDLVGVGGSLRFFLSSRLRWAGSKGTHVSGRICRRENEIGALDTIAGVSLECGQRRSAEDGPGGPARI